MLVAIVLLALRATMIAAKLLCGVLSLMSLPRLFSRSPALSSLTLAICLFLPFLVNRAGAQSFAARKIPLAVTGETLDRGSDLFSWWTPVRRNPLQADPRIVA